MNTTRTLKVVQSPRTREWATPAQQAVMDALLLAYRRHRGSKRQAAETIQNGEDVLKSFFAFAGAVPGELQPEDFEAWGNHLYLEQGVSAGTQRKYQNTVRSFFTYATQSPALRTYVLQQLGRQLEQVATPENSIVHRRDRELEEHRSRRSFTVVETLAFIDCIEGEIAIAYAQGSKTLLAMQRNKAMFSCTLEMGLRAAEVLGLNQDSFEPNPDHPLMGNFGIGRVFGKGSKWRRVPVLKPVLSQVLQWYVEHVRPQYVGLANVQEKALFLSERGARLSYSAFRREFHRIRELAGLPDELVPHCMRHTSVSQDDMGGLSLEGNRIRHGHVFGSTTQGYMHHPDQYVRKVFNQAIERNLRPSAGDPV